MVTNTLAHQLKDKFGTLDVARLDYVLRNRLRSKPPTLLERESRRQDSLTCERSVRNSYKKLSLVTVDIYVIAIAVHAYIALYDKLWVEFGKRTKL